MGITTTGLNELIANLESAGKEATPIVRKGLRAGAEVFQAAIVERAPERPNLPSGTALPVGALKTDIVIHRGVEDGNEAMIVGPDKLTRHVADWVEYGHRLVRGGTSKETAKGSGKYRGRGKHVGDVHPWPFIRPAFEVSAGRAETACTEIIAKEVTKKYGA